MYCDIKIDTKALANLPATHDGLLSLCGPVLAWWCCAVNPKRILKSKARAAAEADRDAKRSKALTTSQALAEAKAAALASGWDTDDDFETLPRR